MPGRNRFINPVTAGVYLWDINHTEEEEGGMARNIDHTAPTSGLGLVRQQGEEGPMEIKLIGTILKESQFDAFQDYYQLSRSQTFYFRDFNDDEYEVVMTAFRPTRKRTLRNSRAPGKLHYWTYTMTLEVLAVRAGPWVGTSL